jgi:hypothetical protein
VTTPRALHGLVRFLLASVGLLSAGCAGATGEEPDDTAGRCDVRVGATFPEDGATDAYTGGTVEFALTGPDPFATVEVAGVAGAVSFRGAGDATVVFTPDAPLAPLTAYEASLAWCGGTQTLSFTTSAAGLPLEDPAALAGRVFAVPFASGRVVEPAGAAGILLPYLTQTDLLRVDEASDGTLTATNALAVDGTETQDWCVPTTTLGPASFAYAPRFALAGDGVRMVLAGYVVTLRDLAVTGTFTADGRAVAGGDVRYVLDTRELAPLVDPEDPESFCLAAAQFDEACAPCPDSDATTCMAFHLDALEGAVVDGLALDAVPGVDCEGCDERPPPIDAMCSP